MQMHLLPDKLLLKLCAIWSNGLQQRTIHWTSLHNSDETSLTCQSCSIVYTSAMAACAAFLTCANEALRGTNRGCTGGGRLGRLDANAASVSVLDNL